MDAKNAEATVKVKDLQELDLKLILEVQKHIHLYSVDTPDEEIVENSWKDIAKQLDSTVNDCKNRWTDLNADFTSRSSDNINEDPLLKNMEFILPYIRKQTVRRKIHNSIENQNQNVMKIPIDEAKRPKLEFGYRQTQSIAEKSTKPNETDGHIIRDKHDCGTNVSKCDSGEIECRKEFLLSLSEDMKLMTGAQERKFRQNMVYLVDGILNGTVQM